MTELEDVLKGLSANRIGSVNFGFSLLASLASIVRDVSEDYLEAVAQPQFVSIESMS